MKRKRKRTIWVRRIWRTKTRRAVARTKTASSKISMRKKKEKDYVEDVEDGVGEECTLPLGPSTDCPRNQIYPIYPELAGKVSSSPKWRSEEFV